MRPGWKGDEFWVRCWICGDSTRHSNVAHNSVNIRTGMYHCFRCKATGRLAVKDYIGYLLTSFTTSSPDLSKVLETYLALLPGAGSERPSLLNRYHTSSGSDMFLARDASANITGLYGVQAKTGKRGFLGIRSLGWVGEDCLTSDPENPLVLVEGPYDVVKPYYICTFGLISQSVLNMLKGQSYWIMPDGDVWSRPELIGGLFRLVVKNHFCLGLRRIPSDKDPDTATSYHTYSRDMIQELVHEDNVRRRRSRWSRKDYLDQFHHRTNSRSKMDFSSSHSTQII